MTFLWFQMIYAYETPEPAETKTPHEQNRHSPEKIWLLTTTPTNNKGKFKINQIDWGGVGNGYLSDFVHSTLLFPQRLSLFVPYCPWR